MANQMTDLIPITSRVMAHQPVNTVDGRHLHAYLVVNKDYSGWIKSQIKRAHLVENRDFIVFTQKGENLKGGRPTLEYHFTFDAAKHVAMISSAEKGHVVRDYFIAKEKELAAVVNDPRFLLQAYPELLAIQNLLLVTAEARGVAEQAQRQAQAAEQRAVQADTKADLAIANQLWSTIREYCFLNKLQPQMPPSLQKEYGLYLTDYCIRHGVPVRKIGIADRAYGEENGYLVEQIAQTLEPWLRRRQGQGTLVVLPQRDRTS